MLFECPQSRQIWALSRIPSNPEIFPRSLVYANLDYLFWRIPKTFPNSYYPWIIWYIWKTRNDKIFKAKDWNPQDILYLAETEGQLWKEAQLSVRHHELQDNASIEDSSDEWWCYIDGAWRELDVFSGQGWVYRNESVSERMMGTRNIRRSLSPLHAEVEALIWAMECIFTLQYRQVIFATNCPDLINMICFPEDWPAFSTHLEEFQHWRSMLNTFKIRLILRAKNGRADKLARSARTLAFPMVYVDSLPPRWASDV